jgi:hypothetical protein
MNLINDLKTIIAEEFRNIGKTPPFAPLVRGELDTVLYHFVETFHHKRVPVKPRAVFASQQIKDQLANPTLPWIQSYTEIIQKIGGGEDINPYLSKNSIDIKRRDPLLNDWGIHHIHLNTKHSSADRQFSDRADYLLLAYFRAGSAYLINVYRHKETNIWSKQELLRIIKQNWPVLLEDFHLKTCIGLETTISDEEYGELREVGMNSGIQIGDEVFIGPGGGITAAGTSVKIQRSVDDFLEDIEYYLKTPDDIRQMAEQRWETITDDTDFVLRYDGSTFFIAGSQSGKRVL